MYIVHNIIGGNSHYPEMNNIFQTGYIKTWYILSLLSLIIIMDIVKGEILDIPTSHASVYPFSYTCIDLKWVVNSADLKKTWPITK